MLGGGRIFFPAVKPNRTPAAKLRIKSVLAIDLSTNRSCGGNHGSQEVGLDSALIYVSKQAGGGEEVWLGTSCKRVVLLFAERRGQMKLTQSGERGGDFV